MRLSKKDLNQFQCLLDSKRDYAIEVTWDSIRYAIIGNYDTAISRLKSVITTTTLSPREGCIYKGIMEDEDANFTEFLDFELKECQVGIRFTRLLRELEELKLIKQKYLDLKVVTSEMAQVAEFLKFGKFEPINTDPCKYLFGGSEDADFHILTKLLKAGNTFSYYEEELRLLNATDTIRGILPSKR